MTDGLLDLFVPDEPRANGQVFGVAVGIVTDNKDPNGLGRVRVRFPWLGDATASFWARVATPMAGKERGVYFLPEVDDEVLVAFHHGRVDAPVVLGGLWNGKDKPPADNADGRNNIRVIKSRSGHLVRLDDSDGKEKIEIIDKSGKNKLVIDTAANTVTIAADADIVIQSANGKLALSGKIVEIKSTDSAEIGSKAVKVNADGHLTLKGQNVDIN
jgi:uncharacterized protein involved in type VI secretion and phage assembly